MKYNHRELCEIGAKWLKKSDSQNGHGCRLALIEPKTYTECPDVIGFRNNFRFGHSYVDTVVLEVKTSRSDFFADSKKPHRQENCGMGVFRYYLVPEGLITENEIPNGWGLLYVNNRGWVRCICGAMYKSVKYDYERMQNLHQWRFNNNDVGLEMTILVMWLSRINDPEEVAMRIRESSNLAQRLQKQLEKEVQDKKVRSDNLMNWQRNYISELEDKIKQLGSVYTS